MVDVNVNLATLEQHAMFLVTIIQHVTIMESVMSICFVEI